MANEAERVVVELLAKVDGFDGKIKQSASAFGNSMKTVEQSAASAERVTTQSLSRAASSTERAVARVGVSTKQLQQNNRILGQQMADVGTQLASGTSPFLILAQQGPQVANALEGARGKVGQFAAFLSGPWGAAVLAGVSVLGLLLSKHIDFGDAVDDIVDKLKEQERATQDTEKANALFARSLEGVEKAAREAEDAIEKLRLAKKGEAEQTVETIKKQLDEADALRETTRARLADARLRLELEQSNPATDAEGAALGISRELRAIERIEAELKRADAAAERLRRTLTQAISARTVERVNVSAEEALNKKFDAQIDRAAKAANASVESQRALEAETKRINAAREAELKRLRDTERERRKQRGSGETTRFINPVGSGRISGSFGEPRPGHRHAGIDIPVPVGTRVKATASGTVITAGKLAGYGNVIIVDHGAGTTTRYAHLSQILAKKGASVAQGDVIGLSGGAVGASGSGNSQGPHLHYEVRQGGRAVDPRKGQFPTDRLAAEAKAADQLARQAEAEADRKVRVANEEASLDAQILRRKQTIAESAAAEAQLELQSIEQAEKQYNAELDALVAEYERSEGLRGITRAQAEILKKARAELAEVERQGVERQEQRRIRQENLQLATDLLDNELELLRSEEDVATTQKERRRIALEILDAEYERLRISLENAIKEGEANGVNEKILEAMRQRLKNLETLKTNAAQGVKEDTASPLENWANDIRKTAEDIDAEFEKIAAGSLTSVIDGIGDVAAGFRSLGDVARGILQSLTKDLVKLALKMVIFKVFGLKGGGSVGGMADGGLIGFARGGQVKFPTGGLIVGPGTETSDSIPAITPRGRPLLVSDGEYIIRGSSVRKLGVKTLDQINATGQLPGRYAAGGAMRTISPNNAPAASGGGHGISELSPDAVRQLGGIVRDAVHAMPAVNLYPTLDPARAFEAMLASPGGQRAFFNFVSNNSARFKSQLNS